VTQLVKSKLGEIRQWRIKDFKDYLIFYRIQDTTIEILRVFHGARDLADILLTLNKLSAPLRSYSCSTLTGNSGFAGRVLALRGRGCKERFLINAQHHFIFVSMVECIIG